MLALDLVEERAAVAVGARPIAEALLNEPAGERVELRNAARARDSATGDPAVGADGEDHSHAATDAAIAKIAGVVRRSDLAGDLDEVGAAHVVIAEALTAGPSTGAAAQRAPRAGATAGARRRGN